LEARNQEGGEEAEQDPRGQGEHQGEAEDGRVEVDRIEAWNGDVGDRGGEEAEEEAQAPGGEERPHATAQEGEERALDQELPHHPEPARAQGGAKGQLAT